VPHPRKAIFYHHHPFDPLSTLPLYPTSKGGDAVVVRHLAWWADLVLRGSIPFEEEED
jgi:hypothetical protein